MRICFIRPPDSVIRLESVSLTRGRIGERRSVVCASPLKLAPMPSVEMRRSTRVFVPKTKEAEGVKILRSGRKVCVESGGETKSVILADGQDLLRLIDVSDEPMADRSVETGCQNGVSDQGSESGAMVVDHVEPQLENKVLPNGVCSIKRFGVVYSRKRKQVGVKNSDSGKGGGKRFGLHFFYRKRRMIAKTSGSIEKAVDRYVENRSLCVTIDTPVLCVTVDTPGGRSCEPSAVVTSIVKYMCTAKVGLNELSGFLQSHPIAGVFASSGIYFLLNDSCIRRSGLCKIYDTMERTPLFDLNFSCVPLCFFHLHATMWFRSLRLSYLLLVNADRTDEDDSELDDVLQFTGFREHSSNNSILAHESNDLGVLKMLSLPFEVSRSAIRALPYRNGVVTRSSSQRRRKRSLRTRRARNPSFLGLHRGGSLALDSGIRKSVVRYSSSVLNNHEIRKSIQKKSSNGDIKLLKSSLLALGKDIDSVSSSVNLLVVEPDRCYRECGASVTLELSTSNEWILAIRKDGSLRCYHSARRGQEVKPTCTNRYTYAIIWYVEAGWKLEFTERKEWAIFKELFKFCGDRNIVPPSPAKAIPIPGVCEVPICDISHDVPYVRPESYIKMNGDELSRALLKRTANYDMDCEDEGWLNELNSKLNQENYLSVRVTETTFELLIDAFEKAAFCEPNQFIDEKAPADLHLDLASREVIEVVYSYWILKRKQKHGPLLAVFKLNEPNKKIPVAAKPVLRKKRSMKHRHTHTSNGTNLNGRGKELRVLQAAIAAERNANEEKTAMLEAEQATAAAKSALEVALAKRRRAQTLMANADLAMYRATMAIRLAEAAAQAAEPDQAMSLFLTDA